MRRGSWLFTKEELNRTPSRFDHFSADEEVALRAEGINFLIQVGKEMKFPPVTIATACIIFHRFFMFHSFKRYNNKDIASCCLFLAGKIEETPHKLKDIVQFSEYIRSNVKLDIESKEFWERKEAILIFERQVLQTLAYDLSIPNPYSVMLNSKQLQELGLKKDIMQAAYSIVESIWRTTLCLTHDAKVIAGTALYIAVKMENVAEVKDTIDGKPWYTPICSLEKILEVEKELLEHQAKWPDVGSARGGPKEFKFRFPSFRKAADEAQTRYTLVDLLLRERDSLMRERESLGDQAPRNHRLETIVNVELPQKMGKLVEVVRELEARIAIRRKDISEDEKNSRAKETHDLRSQLEALLKRQRLASDLTDNPMPAKRPRSVSPIPTPSQ